MGNMTAANRVASAQLGLITSGQASESGVSVSRLRTLTATGEWERRTTGLFAVAGAPRTWEQDVMAACLVGGPRALACHGTAARLLDVGRPYFDTRPIEVMVPRGGAARRGLEGLGVIVHETRNLDSVDRARVRGIPLTKACRLVVDMLGRVPDEVLFALADDVLWRLRDRRQLIRTWERVSGHRHRRVFEAVLLPWSPGPKAGSPKEMSLSRVLQVHGLPAPVRQHPVVIPGRQHPRYLDLAYPAEKVTPEYDGRRAHGPRQWDHDAGREDELTGLGWLRLPAGRLDLVEPGASWYCELVRAALASREASPSPVHRARGGGGAGPCSPNPGRR
jgi:hypothetical protein